MTAFDLQKIVASNIKKYRVLNKMTQMQLAEKANLSVGYLCDLESGKKWGTAETLIKICSALKIKPYQLFTDSNIPSDSKSFLNELWGLSNRIKSSIDSEIQSFINNC